MEDGSGHFTQLNLIRKFNEKLKNKSGRGIDGVDTVEFSKNITDISSACLTKISSEKYRFSPYLEIVKSKGRNKSPRVISKPTIRDKLVLSVLKDYLHEYYPGSVSNQLPNTHINKLCSVIDRNKDKELYFVKIDIAGFYDNIDQDILLDKLICSGLDTNIVTLVRRAIRNITVPVNYRKKDRPKYLNVKGVHQGLSISNILASIYLNEFDAQFDGKWLCYFRYVDDILILTESNNVDEIESEIVKKLAELSLKDNDKADKGNLLSGFDYLGYTISSNKISVKDSTYERYISSIVGIFTEYKYSLINKPKVSKWLNEKHIKELFILRLNEKITGAYSENKRFGWVFYFSGINDLHLLHKIDAIVADQFSKLPSFFGVAPTDLKRIVRAYYCARFDPFSGYIHNYNNYDSVAKKLEFLINFKHIADYQAKEMSDEDVEARFEKAKSINLMQLEEDVGNIS